MTVILPCIVFAFLCLSHKRVHPAKVCPLSLFILLIHKLGPEGAAFQTGKPPAAVGSSLPTCQSPFSPGATPRLSGGGVDISGILPSTPKLFIFILSWHFNTPPCRLSDPLPKTSEERKQQLPSDTCQLEARGWMWGPDGTEGRNGARKEGGCQMGFVLFGPEMLNGSLTVCLWVHHHQSPPPLLPRVACYHVTPDGMFAFSLVVPAADRTKMSTGGTLQPCRGLGRGGFRPGCRFDSLFTNILSVALWMTSVSLKNQNGPSGVI